MLAPLTPVCPPSPGSLFRQKRNRRGGGFYKSSSSTSRGGGDENAPCIRPETERGTYRQKTTHSAKAPSSDSSKTGVRESAGQDPLPSSRSFLTVTPKAKRFFETITTRSRSHTGVRPDDKARLRSKSTAASDDKNRLQKMFGSIGKGKALSPGPSSPSRFKDVSHPDRIPTRLAKNANARPPLKSLTPALADSTVRPQEDLPSLRQKVFGTPRRVPPPVFDSADYPPMPMAPHISGPFNAQRSGASATATRAVARDVSSTDHYRIPTAVERESPDVEDWSISTYDGDPFGLEPRNWSPPPPPRTRRIDVDLLPPRPKNPLPPQLVDPPIAVEDIPTVTVRLGAREAGAPAEQPSDGSYRTTSELRGSRSTFDHVPDVDDEQHVMRSHDSSVHPTTLTAPWPSPAGTARPDFVRSILPLREEPAAAAVGGGEEEDWTEDENLDGIPLEEAGHGAPLPSDLTVWWRGEGEYYASTHTGELDELGERICGDVGSDGSAEYDRFFF